MPEEKKFIRKPSWSLDVKLISHLSDMLDLAGDHAVQLELGDGNSLFPLKAILHEVYWRLGGDLESDGNMLDSEVKKQLGYAFKRLDEWEKKNIRSVAGKQEIDYQNFLGLKNILRMIRGLLYTEQNRLFIKFVKIYSATEKAEKYSLGRTEVVKK